MKYPTWKKLLLMLAVCMVTSLLCIPLTVTEAEAVDLDLANTTISNGQSVILNLNGETYTIPKGKRIEVKNGGSLTIKGHGIIKEYNADKDHEMAFITVRPGGTLIIEGIGNGSNSIIFDGNSDAGITTQHPFIRCAGTVKLTYVAFRYINNQNTDNNLAGGAIATSIVRDDKTGEYVRDVDLTMDRCLIRECKSRLGSALFVKSNVGAINITNSLFYNNVLESDTSTSVVGGTIRSESATNLPISFSSCIFRNNRSVSASGAAIFWNGRGNNASLTLTNCQFLNNTAGDSGAAIFSCGKDLTITGTGTTMTEAKTDQTIPLANILGTRFEGNDCSATSSTYGGAVCITSTAESTNTLTASITGNVLIKGNYARRGGGLGVLMAKGQTSSINLQVEGVTFDGNKATGTATGVTEGGGINISKNTDVSTTGTISNSSYLKNITIQNCTAASGGGLSLSNVAIQLKGSFTVNNCTAMKTTTSDGGTGGAIFISNSTLSTDASCSIDVSENNAQTNGGGIHIDSGTLTLSQGCNITVSENTASNYGGGMYVCKSSSITLDDSASLSISNNEASISGGGVCITNQVFLTLEKGTINGNTATTNGGGIYVGNKSTLIFPATSEVLVSDNKANYGGGVSVSGGSTFTMASGTIKNNQANNAGGGVDVDASTFTLSGGTIQGQKSSDASSGGGVYVTNTGAFTMTGGTIQNMKATNGGGGIYVSTGSSFTMTGGTIQNCIAQKNGGGVYLIGANTVSHMTGGLITNNKVIEGNGGAIYLNSNATFRLEGGTLSKNTAIKSGGGVSVREGYFFMTGGLITQNQVTGTSATYCGGGGVGVYGDRIGHSLNVYIHGGTISNNYSAINGGGIAAKVNEKTDTDQDVSDVTINVYVGCSDCCGEKSGQTVTCTNVGTGPHTCPVITGNTAKLDGGGFYLHSTDAPNSSASLYLYCGESDENTASATNSRNAFKSGGVIHLYGFNFGEIDNPGITLVSGDFTKYIKQNDEWVATDPVTIVYWLSWEPGSQISYETHVSEGVVLNTPPYTNTLGETTVSWHVGSPESTEFIYVGSAYEVPNQPVVHLYAVYKAQGHGEEQAVTLKEGFDNGFAPTQDTVSIAANATLTAQFVLTDMHPEYYRDRFLSFENQTTDTSILPKAGTTVIMVVHLYKGSSTVREYYYYTFESDYSGPIALTQFKKMGTSTPYTYPQDVEASTFTEYTESYTFIVTFNNTLASDAIGNITLSRYANEAFQGGGTGNIGDIASQTAMFTLCANRSFAVSHSVPAKTEVDDFFTVTYSTAASNGGDSTYNGKYASLVLSGNFAKDTKLTVGSTMYALTSDGKFIVPLGQLTTADAVNTSYTLQFFSKNSKEFTVTAEVWVSDAAGKPFGGSKVVSESVTLQAKTLPALKITMSQRVFDLDDLPENQIISVNETATENGYTVVWIVEKKNESGIYKATDLVSVENGSQLVWNSPTAGTYRIVASVKNGENVVLTVPYNFIILE